MESELPPLHVLLVSFPAQGHINPMLRLGKKLASTGLLVTFSCVEAVGKTMREAGSISDELTPVGDGFIRFEFFKDGCDENQHFRLDLNVYVKILEQAGREHLPELVRRYSEENRRVSCIIANPFIPWVCDVADELKIPCSVLWVQSCAVFSAYYHFYHNKLGDFSFESGLKTDLQLPSMPAFKYDEIPSFLSPLDEFHYLAKRILGQFKNLDIPFCVVMDTFQELEGEILKYMSKFCVIKPVGPLFKNLKAADSGNLHGDCLAVEDCVEWLNSKPPSSVVYISFGSIVYLKQDQMDEIAHGILSSGVNFLLVIKPPPKAENHHVLPDGFLEKAGERGKVVTWSPQEQVLAHPSVSCFVTHCGWNSSVEALASGVPVVTFPQWGDQVTNAKFMVEEFKVGIRLCRGVSEGRLITRNEVEKCLIEATFGPTAMKMKKNALKWKEVAERAVSDGGSSDLAIHELVEEIRRKSTVSTQPLKKWPLKEEHGNNGATTKERVDEENTFGPDLTVNEVDINGDGTV